MGTSYVKVVVVTVGVVVVTVVDDVDVDDVDVDVDVDEVDVDDVDVDVDVDVDDVVVGAEQVKTLLVNKKLRSQGWFCPVLRFARYLVQLIP